MLPQNEIFLIYGSYIAILVVAYLLVSFVFYMNSSLKSKILSITLDPRSKSRGRKNISAAIEKASKEKKMAFLWPLFLLSGLVEYVKEKLKKKE